MSHLSSHHTLPPFSDNIPTAPLITLNLSALESDSPSESDALFTAAKELGFFYLDLNDSSLGEDIVREAEELNKLQNEFFSLPYEVKDRYGRGVIDKFFAYRFAELDLKDEDGVKLRNESYNLRKDDILGNCDRLPCHPLILSHQTVLESYTVHCRTVIDLLLTQLNTHLHLPTGTLANLHRIDHRSGDHVRFTQNPIQPFNQDLASRAEHTDFGSITILFNWLGGLQIRTPETNQWVYVKPVPGSCVVNLGDAMVKFSAGILRSNVHRVVPAVGDQAKLTRNSLVYFSRPEDSVVLKRLKGGLVDEQPVEEGEEDEEEITSSEWVLRRAMGDLHGVYTRKGLERRPMDMPSLVGAGGVVVKIK